MLGRHHKALEKLGLLFKQGKIGKTYWAVVEGAPHEEEGLIDLPLGRLDATRGWWMKVDPQGQPAQTRWKILARGETQSLLALTPLTGRTHQLRVHCAASGFPILGDPIYGTGDRDARLHLLARSIEMPIYKNKDPSRSRRRWRPHAGRSLGIARHGPDGPGARGRRNSAYLTLAIHSGSSAAISFSRTNSAAAR